MKKERLGQVATAKGRPRVSVGKKAKGRRLKDPECCPQRC